jgi:hypothetical protein
VCKFQLSEFAERQNLEHATRLLPNRHNFLRRPGKLVTCVPKSILTTGLKKRDRENFYFFAGLSLHEGVFDDCGARDERTARATPLRVPRFCVRQPQPRPPPHLRTGRGLHRVLKVGARLHRGQPRGGRQESAQIRHRFENARADREGAADQR